MIQTGWFYLYTILSQTKWAFIFVWTRPQFLGCKSERWNKSWARTCVFSNCIPMPYRIFSVVKKNKAPHILVNVRLVIRTKRTGRCKQGNGVLFGNKSTNPRAYVATSFKSRKLSFFTPELSFIDLILSMELAMMPTPPYYEMKNKSWKYTQFKLHTRCIFKKKMKTA